MHVYIVKTSDGYLYPFGNDVSLTDDIEQAGHFHSAQEAQDMAGEAGYYDGGFDVLAIDIEDDRLNSQWQH